MARPSLSGALDQLMAQAGNGEGADPLDLVIGAPGVQALDITQLRLNGGTQPRAALNQAYIDDYAADYAAGAEFPPVIVYHDGKEYWLADGYHRVHAARTAGKHTILALVRQGSQRDAILASVGANADHGLRRSADDKRRAVIRLLEDHEWSDWSNVRIAQQCRVSEGLVRKIKLELSGLTSYGTMLEDENEVHTSYGTKYESGDGESHTAHGTKYEPIEEYAGKVDLDPETVQQAAENVQAAGDSRTFVHPKTGSATVMNTANIGAAPSVEEIKEAIRTWAAGFIDPSPAEVIADLRQRHTMSAYWADMDVPGTARMGDIRQAIAQLAASAPATDPEELRKAVRVMLDKLNRRHWEFALRDLQRSLDKSFSYWPKLQPLLPAQYDNRQLRDVLGEARFSVETTGMLPEAWATTPAPERPQATYEQVESAMRSYIRFHANNGKGNHQTDSTSWIASVTATLAEKGVDCPHWAMIGLSKEMDVDPELIRRAAEEIGRKAREIVAAREHAQPGETLADVLAGQTVADVLMINGHAATLTLESGVVVELEAKGNRLEWRRR